MTALQTKTAMTKDKFNWKFCLCCGLFIWFVINLLQGLFTHIHEDEAYYALFGEHLAWGYFDHPPTVALMTFLSSQLFSGALGVRFCTIIASCLSLFVMWKIANGRPFDPSTLRPFDKLRELQAQGASGSGSFRPRNLQTTEQTKVVELVETPSKDHVLLYFFLAFSILIVNLYGFVTTPDAALLLFSALFLLVYQRYLNDKSWKNTLLMGLLMALMVYSKYHAFLLLGLIVLSNLKLLKDGKFYVACLLALAILTPHILWQVNADFPSLRYHLSGRSEPFRWSYFLEYLPNQLLVFNPFVFGAVVYVLIKHKNKDLFERGLWFFLIGFFAFFWLMTFRGHVEPHWTAVSMISVVVLLYRKAWVDNKLRKYIQWVVAPSLLLVMSVRIALLTSVAASFGFCQDQARYEAMALEAGDHPVAFRGSFQQPALYHYFTGKESSSLCSYYDRRTQYDLWQFDTAWIGKPVYVDGIGLMEHFQTANRLVTTFDIANTGQTSPIVLHTNDTLLIRFSIYNPCPQAIDFQNGMMLKLLLLEDNVVRYGDYAQIGVLQPNETYEGQFSVVLGQQTRLGKNRLLLGIGDQIAIFATPENAVDVVIEAP